MEGKVPHARIVAKTVESNCARQRRVDRDEVRHLVAVVQGVRGGDHQPDVVTDNHDRTVDFKVLAQEALDVKRHRALVVAAKRAPRLPGTAIVRRHDTETARDQRIDHRTPFPPGLREPVHKHNCARPAAGGDVMQPQPRLDVRHAVRQRHDDRCAQRG